MSSEPSKKQTRDGSTETEPETLPAFATSTATTIEVSLLQSINSKLAILEHLHADIKDLKASLEFSQSQILSNQVNHLTSENRIMKEKILDLQCRSMRDNLIFPGIPLPTSTPDDPEKAVKEFMQSSLKIPPETVNRITFHRVHRLTSKDNKKQLPIIAKFEHYKHKELIKSKGKELKGTSFGLNDQFPQEIQERRRALLPIMKQLRQEGNRATLSVDKLYVNGALYRNPNITTWL
ncbi:hypothetical protein M9458_042935 [Cirrhinus mrigala]|uniref:Uncharacterized protein n=1 Tax=Cirrhinus mrigala TaxID=683832 RepID=A0ABD0NCY4_CIRMR